jgi:hypothetical protein
MDYLQKSIDLELWLNAELIQRQNLLKRQFIAVLEDVGNSFSSSDFQEISPKSRGVKISKGNDLLGFPYQVLDLIRDFDFQKGANIRLLNWIGKGFYLTVFLGKNRRNPVEGFKDHGFLFGLSDNQWDYPDLILNKNQTTDIEEISHSKSGFYHWIKEFKVNPEPSTLAMGLKLEIKNILGILEIS